MQPACAAGSAAGIGALTNLRELRVPGNRLAGLSPEVGALRKLHRLVADNNALTSLPGARFARCALFYTRTLSEPLLTHARPGARSTCSRVSHSSGPLLVRALSLLLHLMKHAPYVLSPLQAHAPLALVTLLQYLWCTSEHCGNLCLAPDALPENEQQGHACEQRASLEAAPVKHAGHVTKLDAQALCQL